MTKENFLNKNGDVVISKVLSREVCYKIRKELKRDGYSTYLDSFLSNLGIHYDDFEDIDELYDELSGLLEETIFVDEDNTIFTFKSLKEAFIDQIEGLDYYDEYDCDLSFNDFLRDYDIYESGY